MNGLLHRCEEATSFSKMQLKPCSARGKGFNLVLGGVCLWMLQAQAVESLSWVKGVESNAGSLRQCEGPAISQQLPAHPVSTMLLSPSTRDPWHSLSP